MTSDDERREVARRLRKAIGLHEFAEVLGFSWADESEWVWNDVSNVVADLIEPSDHIGDSDKMVDRDALLALAEKLEEEPGPVCDVCMGNTALRIREALGVTDD